MNAITEFSFGVKDGKPITDYTLLVERLADEAPRHGYWNIDAIRPLTHAEVAIVMRANPAETAGCLDFEPEELAEHVANALVFGAAFQLAFERSARRVLLPDIQDECERRVEYAQ